VAETSLSLSELLRNAQDAPDFFRTAFQWLLQALIEEEASQKIGAGRYERTPERLTQRNGHRPYVLKSRMGPLELGIPKLRKGSFFPSLLQPRRQTEKALLAVIQEAYVHGVSTRKVDELVESLGLDGISKSEVSRIVEEIDHEVQAFRHRPLEGSHPYVWLDAKYVKIRENGRVVSKALVVAIGVHEDGQREVLGFDVGPSESEGFWRAFLAGLVERGLHGVQLVISDAHGGLQKAIRAILQGASSERCRVHVMRDLLAHVPRSAQSMVAALVRTIFAQPDQEAARQQLRQVATTLRDRFPQAAELLEEAEEDVLAYMVFPREHWRQIASTNPLERLNREIGRRADVVGIFPNDAAAIRLLGAVLAEQQDEWAAAPRRTFSQESMAKLRKDQGGEAISLPPTAVS
jgi:putative transposase